MLKEMNRNIHDNSKNTKIKIINRVDYKLISLIERVKS